MKGRSVRQPQRHIQKSRVDIVTLPGVAQVLRHFERINLQFKLPRKDLVWSHSAHRAETRIATALCIAHQIQQTQRDCCQETC